MALGTLGFLEPRSERLDVDAQNTGRPGLVALAELQDKPDVSATHFFQGQG